MDDNLGPRKKRKKTENSEELDVSNQTPTQPKANSISSNGEPSKISEKTPSCNDAENSIDGIKQFIFGKSTWITTTIEVTAVDIQKYIERQVEERSFPQKSKLMVFCGHHGVKPKNNCSSMGGPFPDFTNNLKNALKKVEEKYKIIKKEMEYNLSGDINTISLVPGKGVKESCDEEVNGKLEELINSVLEKPNIILIASCFSEYGDFKEFLIESGLCSVILLRNERGSITKGKCFQLDPTQAKLIELIKMDHWEAESPDDLKLRNLILTGRFGTGKTLVITEGTWMRINFCLRKIREYGK